MKWQTPRTVPFTFSQPRFDHTGTLLSPSGPHFTFHNHGDEHSKLSNKLKNYPLSIIRIADKAVFAEINWGHDPSDTTVTGLQHGAAPITINGGLLDANLGFQFNDGTSGPPHILRWVSAGWNNSFHLQALSSLDTSGLSLAPPVIAVFRPRFVTGVNSVLEFHREALRTPWLAEYTVVSCIWIEYDALFATKDKNYVKKGGGRTLQQGLHTMDQGLGLIQNIQAGDGGGSGGGGADGGGGGGGGGDGGGGGGGGVC
ncbi:hypothetical protein EJ05DRAFT_8003 [Pseudovirgaria hyperparasitica]|uniref:Uncharacterized protein n=1 Tax=Pseudovirgaria hyperparasitica TaxID=470096 RepID=A0A6A6WKE8_9PEZI|nr:uncharacterized protein EJ05DRAFT_8003 [Pseudovirgaria hyperparasitica]KAF2762623.1 hypothetical protein EJ05DRAFT_8003 [Pseudovirgaria hyperparasitica]